MNLQIPLDAVLAFGLTLTRTLGVFLFAPVFGHVVVAPRVRLTLAVVIAWLLAPQAAVAMPTSEVALGLVVVREAAIGVALGFAASLVFAGISLMGELASIQGGLGAAAALDPSSGAQSVVLTSLVGSFSLLVFLAVGGHHEVLRALSLSFVHAPIAGSGPTPAGFAATAEFAATLFEVAVRLAAPFTAVMLVSNLAVGMLGRAIPQLNLMSLQLPAQIAVTLLILALGAGPFTQAVAEAVRLHVPGAMSLLLGGG